MATVNVLKPINTKLFFDWQSCNLCLQSKHNLLEFFVMPLLKDYQLNYRHYLKNLSLSRERSYSFFLKFTKNVHFFSWNFLLKQILIGDNFKPLWECIESCSVLNMQFLVIYGEKVLPLLFLGEGWIKLVETVIGSGSSSSKNDEFNC